LNREIQNDFTFADAACAARARVGSAMRRIEHDDV